MTADDQARQAGTSAGEAVVDPQDETSRPGGEVEETLGRQERCLALFTAPWCGVDRLVRSELARLVDNDRSEAASEAVVVVDCNALPHLADRYRIDVFPTFLLLQRGTERGRRVGAVSRQDLSELLTELRR